MRRCAKGESKNRAMRITHKVQIPEARDGAEGARLDAHEPVAALLKDGDGERSEVLTHVGVKIEEEQGTWWGEARQGASRTRYRVWRLVRLAKDPAEMLVSWLDHCSGMGRIWGVRWQSSLHGRHGVGRES